jgi:hypothetical protein
MLIPDLLTGAWRVHRMIGARSFRLLPVWAGAAVAHSRGDGGSRWLCWNE